MFRILLRNTSYNIQLIKLQVSHEEKCHVLRTDKYKIDVIQAYFLMNISDLTKDELIFVNIGVEEYALKYQRHLRSFWRFN